jgi:hypothetical protein
LKRAVDFVSVFFGSTEQSNMRFELHPSIRVARVGNSTDEFSLKPETIGGMPIERADWGELVLPGDEPVSVEKFKDAKGLIKR